MKSKTVPVVVVAVSAVVAVVVASVAVWFVMSGQMGGEPSEATEPVAGERQLRDPVREARGEPRVVLIAMDGVGGDELAGALDEGRMPRLQQFLGEHVGDGTYAHAYLTTEAMSTLPSTTMAAWSTVFTGVNPAEHGVPGNEWFAREQRLFYAPAPVSVEGHSDTIAMLNDDLLGAVLDAETLYERADVRSHVALAPVYRGADRLGMPGAKEVAKLFEGSTGDESAEQSAYRAVDEGAVDAVIDTIDAHGLADLQVVYFPGIDLFTHVAERPLESMRDYLQEVVDPAVGRIIDAYAERHGLEQTHFVFVSDHGHTPVPHDDEHALGSGDEGEPPALLEEAGFRVKEPGVGRDEGDYQSVVAYQGAMAYIYLADRSTCPEEGDSCDWNAPPRLDEDVLPVARAFFEADRSGKALPEMRDSLELVLARQPRPTTEDALPFEVFDGDKLVPIDAYLEREPMEHFLRFEERMAELAKGPRGHRAGDVLLIARSGASHPLADRYYFSRPYHSWHGSAEAQDSHVPLLVARKGADGAQLREFVEGQTAAVPSLKDITPLVLQLLKAE
ncbi:MAG: alkaline phosphatase family protein [Persicimonas sp.]